MTGVPSVAPQSRHWMRTAGDFFEIAAAIEEFGLTETTNLEFYENAVAVLSSDEPRGGVFGVWESFIHLACVKLWISASRGNLDACMVLANEIEHFTIDADFGDNAREMHLNIMRKWRERAVVANASAPRQESFRLMRRTKSAPEFVNDEYVGVEVVFEQPRSAGVVVVPSIGDPTSKEGAALSQLYKKKIGRKLPYSKIDMPPEGFIENAIASEWPWAAVVGRRMEDALRIQRALGVAKPILKPMLFVGPPGSGKTALAMRIAELLGTPSVVVATAGAGDSAGLASVARGWAGSKPCSPVIAAMQHDCCDPTIIIDEIDKAVGPGSSNGSATGTLLGMLGNQERFQDTCLITDVNLTHVTFMATANGLKTVAPALLDRFNIMMVPRPGIKHFDSVLASMKKRVAKLLDREPEFLPALSRDEYDVLRMQYVRADGSLRDFSRAYDYILSQAVVRETVEHREMRFS